MSSRVRSAIIRIIFIVGIVFLALIVASDAWPLFSSSSMQFSRRAIAQRGLAERITKNALIIVCGDKSLRAQSIGELQVTLPGWERVQRGLLNGDAELGLSQDVPGNIKIVLLQARGDFSAIDAAARAILAHPDNPANATQLAIILDHEQEYYLAMASVADLWQDNIVAISKIYFGVRLAIGLILISSWILLPILHKQERKAIQKRQKEK